MEPPYETCIGGESDEIVARTSKPPPYTPFSRSTWKWPRSRALAASSIARLLPVAGSRKVTTRELAVGDGVRFGVLTGTKDTGASVAGAAIEGVGVAPPRAISPHDTKSNATATSGPGFNAVAARGALRPGRCDPARGPSAWSARSPTAASGRPSAARRADRSGRSG